MIHEDFLQAGWKTGLFLKPDLQLTDGRKLEIINRGIHNKNNGPDFSQAKIRIDNTIWAGSIEFHVKSSDWIKHGHSADPAYKNVILHIVWEHDTEIQSQDGYILPCLELKNIVSQKQLNNYLALIQSLKEIPCEDTIREVDSFTVYQMLQRTVVDRIERKTERIHKILCESQNDWHKAFYKTLFRNFGFKTNQHAFEDLADRIPVKVFDLLKDKPLTSEALLIGCSGLLSIGETADEYTVFLKEEFKFLKHKYNLNEHTPTLWKFSKMRPHNFPFIRLVQLASLLNQNYQLPARVLEAQTVKELIGLFNTNISEYWKDHYKPGVEGKFKNNDLSKDSIDLLIINTCVPFVFLYGKESGTEGYCEKALSWLENIKPENNNIIKYWRSIGIKPTNCFETQALIELKESYCTKKRCMDCLIGYEILKK
ncbi:MAG: DUF2851 family protein [Bacteroidetes bacterium]|nr:DUF2851 family protein [Bacteroidota bacterium]